MTASRGFSAACHASDEFLDPLFKKFFEKLKLALQLRRCEYHILASLCPGKSRITKLRRSLTLLSLSPSAQSQERNDAMAPVRGQTTKVGILKHKNKRKNIPTKEIRHVRSTNPPSDNSRFPVTLGTFPSGNSVLSSSKVAPLLGIVIVAGEVGDQRPPDAETVHFL
jgi:hypothetical protein